MERDITNFEKINENESLNQNKELISLVNKKEQYLNISNINHRKENFKLLDYISLVKIISSIFVVMMHTNANYYIYNEYWVSTNIITSFIYCAVPLFCLCIGATLLNFNEKYSLKVYYKRRIIKIIIPIMGWNIIYYFYRIYIIKNFNKTKINFISLYNLYFSSSLYPIIDSLRIFILGYFIIPLLAYVEKKNKIKIYYYCFIILLINNSIIPYFINFIRPKLYNWPYNYNFGYIIYLFAGYIIENYNFNKITKIIIYLSGIIGLLLRLNIALYLTLKNRSVDQSQLGYVNLPCVFYSCSVFLFIKEISLYIFKIINKQYINKIASLSFGPFFLHYLFIWTLRHLFSFNIYSFIYRFFGAFVISFFCFILTAIIKKIPIIKYLTP